MAAGCLLVAAAITLALVLPGRAQAAEDPAPARLAQEEALETEEESGVTLEALRSISFTDVAADAAYAQAVAWAVENGVTLGTSDTTFSPDTICTRGQIATFLYRVENLPAGEAETTPA